MVERCYQARCKPEYRGENERRDTELKRYGETLADDLCNGRWFSVETQVSLDEVLE
jgi:hypothetical protein